MKNLTSYEIFESVSKQRIVLYHGVRDAKNVADIIKNGFDLTKINPLWTNDYAISTMTTAKAVLIFFGRNVNILKIELEGNVADHSDIRSMASSPQQYTKDMIDDGVDAVILNGTGARQVYIYNTEAIKKITLLNKTT